MNRMKVHSGRRGFTLIEILVVIAIVAILVAVIVPAIIDARGNAGDGYAFKTRSAIRELSAGAHAYESEYDYFPGQKRSPASMPTGSLALGECLWGPPSATTALNSFVPFKEEKVMGKSAPESRIPSDRFPDAMPLLYYPSKMDATGDTVAACFTVGDNSSLPGSPNLSSYASEAMNSLLDKPYHYDTFLIIAAGADREYFTDDDLTNWR